MEMVMTKNVFQELDVMEMLDTEGGMPIVIPIVIGVALLLTGCNNGDGSSSGTATDFRLNQIHDQLGCQQNNECLGEGDCPYH